MSDLLRYRRTKATLLPSADHSGIESWPEEVAPTGATVRRRSFDPSWSMTQISSVPDGPPLGFERTKAIVSPSGDHAGTLALSARFRRPLRSTLSTHSTHLAGLRLL